MAASYHPEGVLIIDLDAHMGGGTRLHGRDQEKLVHLHRMTVEHASQRRPAARGQGART